MAYTHGVSTILVPLALALLSPGLAQSESAVGSNGHSASARVNIRVTIPPVVNLLENHHPLVLAPEPGAITARQRIVLHTNVRQGACVELRNTAEPRAPWDVHPIGGEPVSVQAFTGGWRLCTARAGIHTVLIEHRFGADAAGHWPLRTDATLL